MWHLQETNLQFQLQIQEEGNLDLKAGNHALQSSNDFGCCALENLYVDQIHQDFMERNQIGSGIILSLESRVRVQRRNGSSETLFFVGLKSMKYTLNKGQTLSLSFRNIAQFSEWGQILQCQEKYNCFQKSLLLEARIDPEICVHAEVSHGGWRHVESRNQGLTQPAF